MMMNRILLSICLLTFVFPVVYACSCDPSKETAQEIYDRVDGIYFVTVVAINKVKNQDEIKSNIKLALDLEIIDSIKGVNKGILEGSAIGHIPFDSGNGRFTASTNSGSCYLDISFGDTFNVAVMKDEVIEMYLCNPQIIDYIKWNELKELRNILIKN